MVQQEILYLGDLRCEAIHGPSGMKLLTDAPIDNMGKGEYFSPTDLVVSALGTCILTTIGIAARRDSIRWEGAKVLAEKHMSVDAPRRIARIVLQFEMPGNLPAPFRALASRLASRCPVRESLHPGITLETRFHYPD